MRLIPFTLALGAVNALAIHDNFKSARELVKNGAHDIAKTTRTCTSNIKHKIAPEVIANIEDFEEYLDIPGKGQHAFDLFRAHGPHDGPHDGPPHKAPHPPPGKGGKGKKPHHPPPHHDNPHDQRDKSIYEFISTSEYFTILHDIIKGDEHAVKELNRTAANLTLFAPTNRALEKYEKHPPPIEYLRKILLYHLLPEVYPAGRVLRSKTLETLYKEDDLEHEQRLAVDINTRGLTLNYYARVIYIDIFTDNGVIHAVDNLLFPPPKIYDIAEVLPSQFSTFINAAWKTGLVETLNETSHSTIFAPSNFAFAKLGARINAYLFSTRGQPVLTKLLKYHIVPNVLFYSDAVYEYDSAENTNGLVTHYELENSLEEKINVDVSEWGRFKTIVFNGRVIRVSDIPAKNGVLSKLDNIILPYKRSLATKSVEDYSIEEFESLFDNSVENESEAAEEADLTTKVKNLLDDFLADNEAEQEFHVTL